MRSTFATGACEDEKTKLLDLKPDLSDEALFAFESRMLLSNGLSCKPALLAWQMAKFRLPLSAVEETAMEARTFCWFFGRFS